MRYLVLLCICAMLPALEITPQNIPELLGNVPVKYSAEDIVKHIRVMNPGAEVLVYVIDDPEMFNWYFHLPPDDAGYILGLFRSKDNGAAPDIALMGKWTYEEGVFVHEFVHYLEYMIPERRVEIRNAFHKLLTPEFRIGSQDLEGPAEPDVEIMPPRQLAPIFVPIVPK